MKVGEDEICCSVSMPRLCLGELLKQIFTIREQEVVGETKRGAYVGHS
jgi:hypothetical protein